MDWPGRATRAGPMSFHSIRQAMPLHLPLRPFQSSTTDPLHDDATSTSGPADVGAPPHDVDSVAPYRTDAKELNYIQIEFQKNAVGGRRLKKKADADVLYTTIDAIQTKALKLASPHIDAHRPPSKPCAGGLRPLPPPRPLPPVPLRVRTVAAEPAAAIHAPSKASAVPAKDRLTLDQARKAMESVVKEMVQEFVTSNPARFKKLTGAPKASFGAGVSAKTLADRLRGARFEQCVDAYVVAARAAKRFEPREIHELAGKAASMATLEALSALTKGQRRVFERHARNLPAAERALLASEPIMDSMACANARDGVLLAMKDFLADSAAPREVALS
ncbi:hypothetical protein [Roseateles noduli]|uniref:hypothetical protein n=1 Tax=Roseateles noduli TaxID=2052484 RepID=UPI003D652422